MADPVPLPGDLRPLMFSVAYRMLGSVTEAEDVVQEAFLRMHASAPADLRSPAAYAVTVTTRLAIDALRSARRRREQYIGSWLPEPLIDSGQADPARRFEMDETVSVAFLVLLERLSPVERAVFVLREALGYSYAEVAVVTGRTEAACRQALRRARQRIADGRPRFGASPAERDRLAGRFFAAVRDGDLAGLEAVLAGDVVFYGDGGGQAPAARKPVSGPVRVGRFLLGLAGQAGRGGFRLEPASVNGQPGARVSAPDGGLLAVLALDLRDGRVAAIYNQVNPAKLGHLGPPGDLAGLLAPAETDVRSNASAASGRRD
ncbi:MAG: RNA polymerase sigma-70 factor [Streptosporangiaceae bacterium]